MTDFIDHLDHGIHVIDTGFHRPRFDAAYLIVEDGRAAFVDTGTNHSVPRLLAALDAAGLTVESVDYLIVTHVHLDHAGGAGLLLSRLPNARLVVHRLGARHLVHPGRLMDGARAVYGDAEVERSYGTLVSVPADRVIETVDGTTLHLGDRALTFLDTPGHARHHHCIWDARSRGFFTGDTFGLSYREFDGPRGAWLLPTTTPVQFDPTALRASVERLLAYEPQVMYLTHFGPVGNVAVLGRSFLEQLDQLVAAAHAVQHQQTDRHAALASALRALYLARAADHAPEMAPAQAVDLLALDIELNAQGIGIWLDRQLEAPGKTPSGR